MSRTVRLFGTSAAVFGSILLFVSGCSPNGGGSDSAASMEVAAAGAPAAPQAMMAADAPGGGETAPPAAFPRKIIYNANVELVAEKLDDAARRLTEAVKAAGGYVAEMSTSGMPGAPRSGTYKVRVPTARFDSFLAALGQVGERKNLSITSQDVSEEFYDLEARLRNKRAEETRLIQHLQRSTAKLSDILEVEQALSRVREEIERMEGRKRFLANQADLATVTVTLQEATAYRPTRPPSLATEARRTLQDSVGALGAFARGVVLILIGLVPWAVVGAPVAYLIVRARRNRSGGGKPS